MLSCLVCTQHQLVLGWYGSSLYAEMADSVTVYCSSYDYTYACYYGDWYLSSDGSNTEFNCYGHGCYYLGYLYVDESLSELTVNINSCSECDGINDCIDAWYLYCNQVSDIWYGDNYCMIHNLDHNINTMYHHIHHNHVY